MEAERPAVGNVESKGLLEAASAFGIVNSTEDLQQQIGNDGGPLEKASTTSFKDSHDQSLADTEKADSDTHVGATSIARLTASSTSRGFRVLEVSYAADADAVIAKTNAGSNASTTNSTNAEARGFHPTDAVNKGEIVSLFEMATSNLSKDEMIQLFSRVLAGYNKPQKANPLPQDQSNPNKRNQDGEHPDSMQVEETPPKESIEPASNRITIEEIIAKAGASCLFELSATPSQEDMEKLFSIAMAGYNQSQQPKISPQDQSNPNKRNQDGEIQMACKLMMLPPMKPLLMKT